MALRPRDPRLHLGARRHRRAGRVWGHRPCSPPRSGGRLAGRARGRERESAAGHDV